MDKLTLCFAILCCVLSVTADRLVPNLHPKQGSITEVKSLPGWNGTLPNRMFAGFVNVTSVAGTPPGQSMMMHYMFVEKKVDTRGNTANEKTPVLNFESGGPGAPTFWGLFVEFGPLRTNDESYTTEAYAKTGVPSLILNEHAYSNFAHVLAFDFTPPVGFSYCSPPGPSGHATSCGNWTDSRAALVYAEAVHLVFSDHFPSLFPSGSTDRSLHFVGESYSGVYTTTMLDQLFSNPRYKNEAFVTHTFALGDACMGTESGICSGGVGPWYNLLFMYGHAQLDQVSWETLMSICTITELKHGDMSTACAAASKTALSKIGQGYYTYNLWDNCPNNALKVKASKVAGAEFLIPGSGRNFEGVEKKRTVIEQRRTYATEMAKRHHKVQRLGRRMSAAEAEQTSMDVQRLVGLTNEELHPSNPKPLFNGFWCPSQVLTQYVNITAVRTALGVATDSYFFIADDGAGFNYTANDKTSFPIVQKLVSGDYPNSNPKIKVRAMAYDGDGDPCVPHTLVEHFWVKFVSHERYVRSAEWHTWGLESTGYQVTGGHVESWKEGQITYATVRGSGHMVPEYENENAETLMKNFIFDRTWN